MATIPSNSSTVVVDDIDPSIVYGGGWIRFVQGPSRIFFIVIDSLAANSLDQESQPSSITQAMALQTMVLPHCLHFTVGG